MIQHPVEILTRRIIALEAVLSTINAPTWAG
jgi:hypothetical protein